MNGPACTASQKTQHVRIGLCVFLFQIGSSGKFRVI
jgi:hypothetical protein